MITKPISATTRVWFSLALALLTVAAVGAQAAEMKLQAFLLWGTDDSKPPEGKAYQPVNADIRQKLKDLPLKWTNWFEVKRVECEVAEGASKEVTVSDKCQLNVSKLAGSELEVTLIGKGKEVVKRKQSLPKGEMLVLGGNAPNATAWLVVLKRIE
jgi:hypothetical protein